MDITQMLERARGGDTQARADVIHAAYQDLRQLAAGKMAKEQIDHTLTATALVNEVSLKLLGDNGVPLDSRKQFFGYVSTAMRNLLVDHARTKRRVKRGGGSKPLELKDALVAADQQSEELLALNDVLDKLGQEDPRKAQVVEMRYFAGMSNQEIAEALDISLATVKREWSVARTWLFHQLSQNQN